MDYQNLDFDADRPAQIKGMREEMARLYKTNGEFGPVGPSDPTKPIAEMSVKERAHIDTTSLADLGGIKCPYERNLKIGSPRWDIPLQWDNSPHMNRSFATDVNSWALLMTVVVPASNPTSLAAMHIIFTYFQEIDYVKMM